jgi:hypothetical protein
LYPTIVGKLVQDHVGGVTGHEDENRDLNTIPNDVLEVPDVTVKLSSGRRTWTYGTVGVGVDYGPTIWKEHEHVFTSHTQPTTHKLPTQAKDLGRPNRLKPAFLNDHPEDCLLVEGESHQRWIPWINKAKAGN